VFKLFRLRWVIFVSGFKRAKPLRKFFTLFVVLLIVGVFVGSSALTTFILRWLNSPLISQSGINMGSFLDTIRR